MANFRPRAFQVGVTKSPATLSVGNIGSGLCWSETRAPGPHIKVRYQDITKALLDALSPDVIFSPLVDLEFDVWDLASRLEALQFKGTYYAVTDKLPSPGVILEEVGTVAPTVHFEVIVLEELRRVAH